HHLLEIGGGKTRLREQAGNLLVGDLLRRGWARPAVQIGVLLRHECFAEEGAAVVVQMIWILDADHPEFLAEGHVRGLQMLYERLHRLDGRSEEHTSELQS